MRSPSHRFRRIFRAKSEAKAKSENRPRCRAKSESRPRWKNPDLGAGSAGLRCRAGAAGLLCRAAGASQPLAKKSVLQSSPTGGLEFFSWEESRPWAWQAPMPGRFAETVGLDDSFGKNPDLGRAPMPGRRGREAGMWRARRWASPYWASHQTRLGEPSNEVGRASTHWGTRLGEPVVIGRARTHWANPYWASHQTRLGRAIKRGWASQY